MDLFDQEDQPIEALESGEQETAVSAGEPRPDDQRAEEQRADDLPLETLDESGLEVDALAGSPEEGDGRAWYVVHCYSGYENKVRHNLEQRIETMGMKDKIFDVVVPTEEEIEVKEGKRRTVERRVFPGYILVNMVMTEEVMVRGAQHARCNRICGYG